MILIATKRKAPRTARKRVERLTLAMIVCCYAVWLGAGLLFPSFPLVSSAAMALAAAFHSSLQHEALHGHPTRNAKINEALVFLPIGVFYPFRRYKTLHLRHHADERLTDPYDDPESYYRALGDWNRLPAWTKRLLGLNNTLLGRVVLGPAISVAGFTFSETRLALIGTKAVRTGWALHLTGLALVLCIIHWMFAMPLWAYGLVSYAALSLLSVRSFCEHQWADHPDGRTVIVEKSFLGPLFLNNNLHLVHHKRPSAPWYELPRLYREERDEWRKMNGGYVFASYLDVVRAFGFRGKEPVVHPSSERRYMAVEGTDAA